MLRSLLSFGRRRLAQVAVPLLGAALLASPAQAQVSTYTFAASAGTFTPLPASATDVNVLRGDDETSGLTLLPLGFTFVYDGLAFTGVKASSNGFLSFNPVASYTVGNSLSGTDASTEKPLLAPLWDDLSGNAPTSRASYQTTGTAPNRVFTFEWKNWKWSYQAPTPSISFQVKLYEGSNRIEYVYQPIATAPSNGPSLGASVGLAGIVGGSTPSAFVSLNSLSAAPTASSTTETKTITTMPADGQTYSFTPPASSACEAPISVTVSNITNTTAQVSVQGRVNTTGYTLTYQAAGGSPQTVTLTAPTTSTTLTGLQTGITYSVSVTASCGSQTSPATTASFATVSAYCSSGLGGSCTNNMTTVNLQGTTLNATGLTCATGAYISYPASGVTTANLERGTTYQLSVSSASGSRISAWIDFNQNLVFEASEWVQVATNSSAGTPSTVNISVPATALLGSTGLRLRSSSFVGTNGAGDACSNFGAGETKDFVVNIVAPLACPSPSALAVTGSTSSTATLSFVTNGTGPVTLVYGPSGFNPTTGGTTLTNVTSPVTVTGLQPGTLYQFYVQQNCGTSGVSANAGPANFNTTPINDDPCTAQVLPLNPTACVRVAGSSIGATAVTPGISASACMGANINPRDVWYSVTTAASGPGSTGVRISVTGNSASLVQLMRTTNPGCSGTPFVNVRCVGNTSNVAAPVLEVTTGMTPSTTYYVRVHTFEPNDALGTFTICATAPGVTAGRAAAAAPTWSVFPSPSSTGQLTVSLPQGAGRGQVRLLNALGQVVRQQPLAAQPELTLSTRGLAAGLYTVQVEQNGSLTAQKVVLE